MIWLISWVEESIKVPAFGGIRVYNDLTTLDRGTASMLRLAGVHANERAHELRDEGLRRLTVYRVRPPKFQMKNSSAPPQIHSNSLETLGERTTAIRNPSWAF